MSNEKEYKIRNILGIVLKTTKVSDIVTDTDQHSIEQLQGGEHTLGTVYLPRGNSYRVRVERLK